MTVSELKLKITQEQAMEMPMVDVAFLILKAGNTPQYYRDLMQEVAKVKGIPDEEIMNVIAQLYTEINIDGRFACVGSNLWGLKRWYPVDKGEGDPIANASRPRIINDDDDDFEDDNDFEQEEETEDYDGDEDFEAEDYDGEEVDEDADEEIDEELDEEEIDDDSIDDEELDEDSDFEEEESDEEDSFDDLDEDDDDK